MDADSAVVVNPTKFLLVMMSSLSCSFQAAAARSILTSSFSPTGGNWRPPTRC